MNTRHVLQCSKSNFISYRLFRSFPDIKSLITPLLILFVGQRLERVHQGRTRSMERQADMPSEQCK